MAASSSNPLVAHVLITGAVVGPSADPDRSTDRWFIAEHVDDEGGRMTFWEGDRHDLAIAAASLWAAGTDMAVIDQSGVQHGGR